MKRVRYTADAARALKRHAQVADRLRRKLSEYAENPASQANNVKALTGVDAKRLRSGDFRVIFTETAEEILVIAVGPRGSIYE